MRAVMLVLFFALLCLVVGGLYLAYPDGVTSVRFLVVLAMGVLGVIAYIIYEKTRRMLLAVHEIIEKLKANLVGWGNPPTPPESGQPPPF